eukprot:Nitzschia sp. Nitz4//scaffold181_size46380//15126//16682//NITZ4_007173-RA/size46380-augustus-gene-0.41-mRNA-1//1//CDS//3329539498//5739//frame0
MNDIQALEALLSSINHRQQPQSITSNSVASGSGNQATQPVAASLPLNQGAANPPNLQALLQAMNTPQGRTTLASMDVGSQTLLLETIQALGGAPAPAGTAATTAANVPTGASTIPAVAPVPPASSPALVTAVPALNANQLLAQQLRMQATATNAAASGVARSHESLFRAALAGTRPPVAARMSPPVQTAASYSSMPGLSRQSSSTGTVTASATVPAKKSEAGPPVDRAESSSPVNRREQKRAANRISAQRSRKRKKQYIEELKEENDELRKLNQMLEVVPDLIISFDSSGILRFVSKSSKDFIGCESEELIGTSFWNRLCANSVKRLKSVFMDSLAKRKDNVPSVPLGHRVWEVRLKDQDPISPSLALRGALHFPDGSPECVCTIRHWDNDTVVAFGKDTDGASARQARRSAQSRIPTEVGIADMVAGTSCDESRDELKKKSAPAVVSVSGSSKRMRPAEKDVSAYSATSEGERRLEGSDVSSNSSLV